MLILDLLNYSRKVAYTDYVCVGASPVFWNVYVARGWWLPVFGFPSIGINITLCF